MNLYDLISTELETRIGKSRELTRYTEYKHNPVGFVREVLKEKVITPDQEAVLRASNDHSLVAVQSGNETGKTRAAAWITLWWLFSNGDNTKVITTAPTGRQVREILWREIRSRHRLANLPGRCLSTQLEIGDQWFATGFSTDEPQQYQGFHAPHVLLVVDEANGIDETFRDALISCVDGVRTLTLLIGNPMVATGWFYEACEELDSYFTVKMSSLSHPNLTSGKIVVPGAITQKKIDQYVNEFGIDSPVYRSRVLGLFPDEAAEQGRLILRSWVREAIDRKSSSTGTGIRVLSIDCAREGVDKTSFIGLEGYKPDSSDDWYARLIHRTSYQQTLVNEIVGLAVVKLHENQYSAVVIDEVGVGGGVVDGLRGRPDIRVPIYGFKGGSKPIKRPRVTPFLNKKIEAYWAVRNALRTGRLSLDKWDTWVTQLSNLRYCFTGTGSLQLENKRVGKRSNGSLFTVSSPDESDALSMGLWVIENETGLRSIRGTLGLGRRMSRHNTEGSLAQFGLFDEVTVL